MKATQLERQFVLKGKDGNIEIPDPNPSYSLEKVADFLSGDYPEITNGVFGQPTEKDGVLIYEITTSYGTKG